jgi:ATP-dependent DNA ligase
MQDDVAHFCRRGTAAAGSRRSCAVPDLIHQSPSGSGVRLAFRPGHGQLKSRCCRLPFCDGRVASPPRAKYSSRSSPPTWIRPQLALLVKQTPVGSEWLHAIKDDGYRLHARVNGDDVRLLTRSGLDWTHKYPATAEALSALAVGNAYVDGELCALREDGTTSFSVTQAASDDRGSASLVYFAFDCTIRLSVPVTDFTSFPLRS